MKKIFVLLLISTIMISSSACSAKSEEKPLASAINVKKTIMNSYEELDKLPENYTPELALKNGDVVYVKGKPYNVEKLKKFIENFKSKLSSFTDMIRITNYTDEGDAVIEDLTADNGSIKLIEDSTRDIIILCE